ncbi:Dual-specificity kinase, spindle pole body (SPB) duplication and spindle checkpoint function [Mortierella claussenii]|nr:Dual-specificity kinase, spindle pole body (SPB) duplication and spindle checkpoint function [Mortierella claussenii]
MMDLEAREKKRAPPPKLQPIKVGPTKDTSAYLADYFGQDSLPFVAASTVSRPPKRPVDPKAKTSSSTPVINASSSSNARTTNINATSTESDAHYNGHINKHVDPPTPNTPVLGTSVDSTAQYSKAASSSDVTSTGAPASSESAPLHRLRSSSRLAEQDTYQSRQPSSSLETGKAPLEELIESPPSELKPTFMTPQPKLFRNPAGKENLLPQTPISSRSKNLKPITKTGPRKSFNWGRPHRGDVAEPEEQNGSRARTGGDTVNSTGDLQVDQETRDTGAAVKTSGSFSPDISLSLQEEEEFLKGPLRMRQGSHRDYDEMAPASKKMRHEYDSASDRLEVHQKAAVQDLEVKATSVDATAVTSAATSSVSTTPAHSPDLSLEPVGANLTPKLQNTYLTSVADNASPQETLSTPKSPHYARTTQSGATLSTSSTSQRQQPPHTEGIALIAQHLAVGSAKAPPMPRSNVSSLEANELSAPVLNQRLIAGIQPSATMIPTATATAPASTAATPVPSRAELGARQVMMVNNRPYTRLAQVGKGGSSKVYRVLASNNRIFALKKVSFERAEQTVITGYVNEVKLLTRLGANSRIIRLWDAEINYPKGSLSLVMEYGEIDLAQMLLTQREQPFDIHFIGLYWRQMLEAVQVIHDEKIVHSDLKPANFLMVEGSLKLIDFGIANAIANDTTNIHREGQVGTANYMAPEAIASNPTAGGCRKLGRASDVWSLGCILYQMVYGKTPFSDIQNVFQKLNVITNPAHRIEFARTIPSPLQPKRTPPAKVTSVAGSAADTAKDAVAAGPEHLPPGEGQGCAANVNETVTASLTAKIVAVDPHLIRIMRKCLAYDARDRTTIPELLVDPFLHPYRLASSPSLSSVPHVSGLNVSGDMITMDVDTLQEVMRASMVFGASQAMSAPPGDSRKLISDEVVRSATKDMMLQLQRRSTETKTPMYD